MVSTSSISDVKSSKYKFVWITELFLGAEFFTLSQKIKK